MRILAELQVPIRRTCEVRFVHREKHALCIDLEQAALFFLGPIRRVAVHPALRTVVESLDGHEPRPNAGKPEQPEAIAFLVQFNHLAAEVLHDGMNGEV